MSPTRLASPLPDRLPFLRRRGLLMRATRAFLEARGMIEVETPYAVATPGEEVHLRAFRTTLESADGGLQPLWLHTSPEFAMKRIVAETGLPVFQFARVWRNGEAGALHAPEFTMLEWYRPGADLDALMDETEALFQRVLPPVVRCRGVETRLDGPFERLAMADAFRRHVGADLLGTAGDAPALAAQAGTTLREGEDWEDLFFRLLLERVEPRIGRDRPCFLTHWPAAQAALARRDPTDDRVALRFELFVAGMELANAFDELTDPAEQRRRFDADRARRASLPVSGAGAMDWPMDEALLEALSRLPPCAGIAVGFDRLAMLAAGAGAVADVMWLSDH
ncbi:EF-P lysine aminoacylase EpmA [Rhizosaccharibacter radicis]|uniref:EF-P lysine aminoacylase EpmA n=1 Tax=Rhizosaccharibacter radicis TaxID=2782605 RepID=A0ABT1VX12_9PROT|nr:EF-P lysine aminoacylase EpmA [Acetobacteraceae bacterium KSS12]